MDVPRPPLLPPLAAVLPPLFVGTATFNTQYVDDPVHMPYRAIVRRALVDLGLRGFDTSPYYGPSEALLGEALAAVAASDGVARSDYFLDTKAGRIHSRGFDYAPAAIQASVARSLARLRTPYVDLVYAHDVEFVSPDEVVAAVRALRQLRYGPDGTAATGVVRYVGISGFPLDVLVDLAERILRETGEPVDAVLSYGHCTVQNTRLVGDVRLSHHHADIGHRSVDVVDVDIDPASPLARLRAAGVSVVLNASLLNMGLLTTRGVDHGPQAAWHPSPHGLRKASADAARFCQTATVAHGASHALERIALRYSLDLWSRAAGAAGVGTTSTAGAPAIGASVLGVTSVEELLETVQEWWSVLDGLGIPRVLPDEVATAATTSPSTALTAAFTAAENKISSLRRMQEVKTFVQEKLWPIFGGWKDYSWRSPSEGWVNELAKGDVARL